MGYFGRDSPVALLAMPSLIVVLIIIILILVALLATVIVVAAVLLLIMATLLAVIVGSGGSVSVGTVHGCKERENVRLVVISIAVAMLVVVGATLVVVVLAVLVVVVVRILALMAVAIVILAALLLLLRMCRHCGSRLECDVRSAGGCQSQCLYGAARSDGETRVVGGAYLKQWALGAGGRD